MSMPVLAVSAQCMTPATSPSGISRMRAPVARISAISASWRGRSSTQTMMPLAAVPFARASLLDALGRGHVETDDVLGISGPDGELVHVDVGRVQHRAARPHRDHRQRVRHVLGGQGRALERVERDVDAGAFSGADLLADVEHRRLVALALADHHDALDVEQVELGAHRVDRRLIGRLLVALAHELRRRDRGRLRHAGEAQRQHAVGEDRITSDMACPPLGRAAARASRRSGRGGARRIAGARGSAARRAVLPQRRTAFRIRLRHGRSDRLMGDKCAGFAPDESKNAGGKDHDDQSRHPSGRRDGGRGDRCRACRRAPSSRRRPSASPRRRPAAAGTSPAARSARPCRTSSSCPAPCR